MKYCIGIDLGTTNSVVAYCPATAPNLTDRDRPPAMDLLPIPQVVAPGQTESRYSLPSFFYLPRKEEVEALRINSSSDEAVFPDSSRGIAGIYARGQAADNPQRVVVAAKSWLCQPKAGRADAILPWQSSVPSKVSAFDCSRLFLEHLVAAWHSKFPDSRIDQQDVVLTVPASFDPAARELTREAALAAGVNPNFVLLEEPQAAVYRFLASTAGQWRKLVAPGDAMLVVDVGGGTTDLTLVTIEGEEGSLELKRLAVGNHVLVGGDNMDLALAFHAAEKFREQGHDLDPWQSTALWHACRDAKERLLSDEDIAELPISVLGRGSSLIGGTISISLQRDVAAKILTEGFFPKCSIQDRPLRQVSSGFQDIGLPYESDPAITKQVAAFLADHLQPDQPLTHMLFNGGVFRADALRSRMQSTIAEWFETPVQTIGTVNDLDTSVAIGAAFYGWTKSFGGIRIRGGTAKAYYVGIETAGLAIPGAPRPLSAVCVAPHGMEEGTSTEVPGQQVGVLVGSPARFRFFASTTRATDPPGLRLNRWSPDELQETEPIELTLESSNDASESFVPVRFESKITELGMLELWCHAVHDDRRWKMEFNARE